ncbi:MAG: four helix bundle protein [Paludibacteraceae bacterium]|nr:four helix bundle protein [Paludibacteraceae bacterium]
MHNFRKLDIWTKSMSLVTEIYQLTNLFPAHERFGLISQMQRAAVSLPTNIAEGSAKSSNKDFARFLEMSIGSSLELETELTIALNLKYIDSVVFESIQDKIIELQKMIIGFKNKLNKE